MPTQAALPRTPRDRKCHLLRERQSGVTRSLVRETDPKTDASECWEGSSGGEGGGLLWLGGAAERSARQRTAHSEGAPSQDPSPGGLAKLQEQQPWEGQAELQTLRGQPGPIPTSLHLSL